jgi:hypothetical protein
MTHKEAREGLESYNNDMIERQKRRINALERALKTAGTPITCWSCVHSKLDSVCYDECDESFSEWKFDQKSFEEVEE